MTAGVITPFNPSRRATARVDGVLPIPTKCRFCGGPVEVCDNAKIYNGRSYGEYPWCVRCVGECDAHVGFHPYTGIPLGTLANAAIRGARRRAKDVFNESWQGGRMTRSGAYARLAAAMGKRKEECHIGHFDEEDCFRVIDIVATWR